MSSILVIDDEKNIRMMVGAALQHVGHEVEEAGDGAEGLARFDDGRAWDLTLLDHRMPGLQGLEVLQEMHRRAPQARVIMVTAFGTVDLAIDAMKAGATDFLRKPFTVEVLRGAVTAALRQAPAGSPAVTYAMTTLNGFKIESRPDQQSIGSNGVESTFRVYGPDGGSSLVTVTLSDEFLRDVRSTLSDPPDRFWHALSEELLANYVWRHAETPPGGTLLASEVTDHVRGWIVGIQSTLDD